MKRMVENLLLVLFPLLLACSDVKMDAKKLEGKWHIVEVKGKKLLKEGLPFMEFDMQGQKVHGNTGCNLFNSTITLDEKDPSALVINPGAATMMACPEMETEDLILQAMGNVRQVKAGQSAEEICLVDADRNVLFVLVKDK